MYQYANNQQRSTASGISVMTLWRYQYQHRIINNGIS